jgi:hypothetical protein
MIFNCTECGELVNDTRREVPNQLCTACEADQLGCDVVSVDAAILFTDRQNRNTIPHEPVQQSLISD